MKLFPLSFLLLPQLQAISAFAVPESTDVVPRSEIGVSIVDGAHDGLNGEGTGMAGGYQNEVGHPDAQEGG